MADLAHVNRFQDLLVYLKSRALAKEIQELTGTFPRDEIYSLTSRLRRSSRSVGAQIAEAWAKRRYEKHFVSKLSDADGEQMETRHWLDLAVDFGYASSEQIARSVQMCTEIGKMLAAMMAKAEHFCRPEALTIRDDQALYFDCATESPNTEN